MKAFILIKDGHLDKKWKYSILKNGDNVDLEHDRVQSNTGIIFIRLNSGIIMTPFTFFLLSPAGNTTLFLLSSEVPDNLKIRRCTEAMRIIPAEQAAIADIKNKSMSMAADEFCLNATRAFGALLAMNNQGVSEWKVTVSGWPDEIRLKIAGSCPIWEVTASLNLPPINILKKDENIQLVELPGISHLLIRTPELPSEEAARSMAENLRIRHGLETCPASGIVWWKDYGEEWQILPIVNVPDAGTTCLENSCGSASLALCAARAGEKNVRNVLQPGGDRLRISLRAGHAAIAGDVWLLSSGNVWLNDQAVIG